MPRKVTNQWDFGELFPPEAIRKVYSVTEVTAHIKGVLEGRVGEVWVSGEISNLRVQGSGHCYFTLKDPGAQLSCVLFRSVGIADRGAMRDGQRVALQGTVTVYEPRGQYQLIVRTVEVQGIGALQIAFERLKQRLQAEGLFESQRKRPIPGFPRRMGLVTSPTGAAIRDVVHTMERRFAGIEILLVPCRVQGTGAEAEIEAAIIALNAWSSARSSSQLDVILVTRGGGSLEDLWVFNEERVARAIAASAIPVISAVGHEIDFTIADFVADLRAATPTAAAEILTAGYVEGREWLTRQVDRLRKLLTAICERQSVHVARLDKRLARMHPQRWLDGRLQRLDEVESALALRLRETLNRHEQRLARILLRLMAARPERRLALERQRFAHAIARLRSTGLERWKEAAARLDRLRLRLELLSPQQVLARGYSITRDEESGRVLRHSDETRPGQRLRTRLYSGEVTSVTAPDAPGGDPEGRREEV